MIIAAILVLLGVVVAVIIPALDGMSATALGVTQVMDYIMYLQNYVVMGAKFVKSFFIVPQIFDVLLGSYVAVVLIYEGYKITMWALQKIPMLSVDD